MTDPRHSAIITAPSTATGFTDRWRSLLLLEAAESAVDRCERIDRNIGITMSVEAWI
jgi:hypothetical protein